MRKFVYIERPLIYFAPGGASSMIFFTGLKEVKESHKKYIGYSFRQTLWQLRQKALYYFMQTLLAKSGFSGRIKTTEFNKYNPCMLSSIIKKLKNVAFPIKGEKILSDRLSKKLQLGYLHEDAAFEAIQQVKHNTMLPYEQLVSLYEQVAYCEKNNIPGSFIECGVWKAGLQV